MALIKAKSSSFVETKEDFSPLCLYEYHYKNLFFVRKIVTIYIRDKGLGLNQKPNSSPVETGEGFSTLCL